MQGEDRLTARSAEALDALVEAGFDPARVAGDLRAEAARAASILSSLNTPVGAGDRALIDVTFARILSRSGRLPVGAGEAALGGDDEAAVDSWIMSGYDSARVPGALRERARRLDAMADAVTSMELDGAESEELITRTLARVDAEADREREDLSIVTAYERRRLTTGVRLADLMSVAAVLLIAGSIVWPVLTSMREQGRRALCQNNLGATAVAMSSYAGSHRDSLPMATASLGGGTWWNVGGDQPQSNSANLYELTRDRYLPLARLACPGNPLAPTAAAAPEARDWRRLEEVSYSYQIMFGREKPRWNGPKAVVLADRSPVVLRAIHGERFDPAADSPNHRSAGQHVLWNDGSVQWMKSPVMENGDNIWLPREVERVVRQLNSPDGAMLRGTETPAAADDTFLGP